MKKNDIQTGKKFVVRGKISKEAIINHLLNELTTLEERYGVEYFSDFNIYFQMYKDDKKTLLVNGQLEPIYTEKIEKSNTYEKVTKLEDGSKLITYNKDIDLKKITDTINIAKEDAKKSRNELYLVTPQEYKIVSIKVEAKKEEIYNLQKKQEQEKTAIRQQKENIEIERLEKFKSILMEVYEFKTIKELENNTTSINKLNSKYRMREYTIPEIMISNNDFVYKASFKDGHVDIYDINMNLIHKHIPK